MAKITPRSEDFNQWYLDVLREADMFDYAPVRGCIVVKPYGWTLYENMRDLRRLTKGDPEGKCRLLLSFAGEEREVADPWYTGNFEATYQDAVKGCKALLAQFE